MSSQNVTLLLEVDKKFFEAENLLVLYRMYKTKMYFYIRKEVLGNISKCLSSSA